MGSHALLLLVLSVRHAHAWTWTICSGGDTCYNADCDYWDTFGYSCYELEYTYGCDCSSCSSCTPSFAPTWSPLPTHPTARPSSTVRPTHSAAPTASPTTRLQTALDQLAHSFCFGRCDLRDQVAAGVNVTLGDGVECADGEGLVYDATGDEALMTPVEIGGEMSVALWVKLSASYASGVVQLVNFKTGSNTDTVRILYDNGEIKASAKTTSIRTLTAGSLAAGEWAHVVATFAETSISVYQDGALAASLNHGLGAPARGTRETYTVGKRALGTLGQLQIFERVLEPAEVALLHNATAGDACLMTPTAAPTRSFAPTSTVGAIFYLSDAGGDGWDGATYTFAEADDASAVIASGTLADGAAGSAYIDSFALLGCYALSVGGGGSDGEIGWRLGEDYHQCNSDLEYVSYDAPAGRG